MNHVPRRVGLCAAALLLAAPHASAQRWRRPPQIGYVWPAGGQQGATIEVTVGGQRLAGVKTIHVCGEGVEAELVEYVGPIRPKQLVKIRDAFREARKQVQAEAEKGRRGGLLAVRGRFLALAREKGITDKQLEAFRRFRKQRADKKRQPNPQLVDMLKVRITVAADAEPGLRALRVMGRTGLSNPVRFVVGRLPELREDEPNEKAAAANTVSSLPVILNGQIMPGDVDRFRFEARRGQQLVVDVAARELVPYLADAVPGWFQATVALYDADGREVAFADDFRFDPDPVLRYRVPQTGEYVLEIRDAIYRGREDFVYRVAVGELPFVSGIFPLGGRKGERTTVSVDGWNLPRAQHALEVTPEQTGRRPLALAGGGRAVPFDVDDLPEHFEKERNDDASQAEKLALPVIVNGRIDRPGDWDVFRFRARKGRRIVAEVTARRLGSPLDSLLRLTDARGRVLVRNDDHEDKGEGLMTHHADSVLSFEAPDSAEYLLWVGDTQHKGGREYAYRLRVSGPRPDFGLRVVPSVINARGGMTVPIEVFVLRQDGFVGEVSLRLVDAPEGFALSGWVPPGQDKARLTLTVPGKPAERLTRLHLEGTARAGGREIRRRAVAADDVMQAFIYRHLVPAAEWVAAVEPARWSPPPWPRIDGLPLKLRPGRDTSLRVKTPRRRPARLIRLELDDPPEGIRLARTRPVADGVELVFSADAGKATAALKGNLIVKAFLDRQPRGPKQGQPKRPARPIPLGALPALPFEVVPN
jgi:hypothetical protein